MRRGRKPGKTLPYTTANLTRHFWGTAVEFPHWRTIATALMGKKSPQAVADLEIEEAKSRLVGLIWGAIEKGDRKFFSELGRCAEALPEGDHGADPLYLALRCAETLIALGATGTKGMKLNRQNLVSLALEQFPEKTGNDLEKTRRALFRKVEQAMPWVKSARDQLKKKVTKRK
jgi:hypothetical protein